MILLMFNWFFLFVGRDIFRCFVLVIIDNLLRREDMDLEDFRKFI